MKQPTGCNQKTRINCKFPKIFMVCIMKLFGCYSLHVQVGLPKEDHPFGKLQVVDPAPDRLYPELQ